MIEYDESKASASDAIRQLSKSPELQWMLEFQTRNDVQWRAVQGVYEQWDHKAEGLTQGASAVIALAVTVATQGAASGFAGAILGGAGISGAAGAVAGKALAAGFQAIVSKAAVSLTNNKGNLSKTLKDLGSNASIKSIATSMVTAGIIAAMPVNVIPVAAADATGKVIPLTAAQHLQANLVRGAIGASVETAINGGKLDRALFASLQSVGVNEVLGAAQGAIGDLTDGVGANNLPVLNMVSHALIGGLAAEATGGRFADGAAAGLASAMAANAGLYKGLSRDQVERLSKVIGGVAALLAGADGNGVNSGANIAESAARNNYLTHAQLNSLKELLQRQIECKSTCSDAERAQIIANINQLTELSKANDLNLVAACNLGLSDDCRSRINALIAFANVGWPSMFGGTPEQRAVYVASNMNGFFDWDTILAKHYGRVLTGELTPQQAFANSQQEAATKNGTVKVAMGVTALAGGVMTCISGVGTPACLIGGVANTALGTKEFVSGVNIIRSGKDLDIFVESLVAANVPRETAKLYASYEEQGLIAVSVVDGLYSVAKLSAITEAKFAEIADRVNDFNKPVTLSTKFVGDDARLAKVALSINEQPGVFDVLVHGSPDSVAVLRNGTWLNLDHRALATYIQKSGWTGEPVRLLSCETGSCAGGFAQDLANKLGVPVSAPNDKLFIFPNGRLVVGPTEYENTGKWVTFTPGR